MGLMSPVHQEPKQLTLSKRQNSQAGNIITRIQSDYHIAGNFGGNIFVVFVVEEKHEFVAHKQTTKPHPLLQAHIAHTKLLAAVAMRRGYEISRATLGTCDYTVNHSSTS